MRFGHVTRCIPFYLSRGPDRRQCSIKKAFHKPLAALDKNAQQFAACSLDVPFVPIPKLLLFPPLARTAEGSSSFGNGAAQIAAAANGRPAFAELHRGRKRRGCAERSEQNTSEL